MITYDFLQNYWWFLISLLGAILVLMLFVQGGQSMLLSIKDDMQRNMVVNSIGRKWEITFTTLVVFGGAFFASFPLFYSTSFGGAYWLWITILLSFVVQAVSYEYRRKKGNLYGTRTYDTLLFLNGTVGTILLGVAVATLFFGAEFTINKQNILSTSAPVISTWSDTHGLEAIFSWRNLLLGFTVLFLARTQAALYFMNNINDEAIFAKSKRLVLINGVIFVVLFLTFLAVLFTATAPESAPNSKQFTPVEYKYLLNFVELWWLAIAFVLGVLLVLFAIIKSVFSAHFNKGIWFSGIGTVLVVLSLLCICGYNNTPYYHSLIDTASSLTIYNSSSSLFTLKAMSVASLFIPFVLAYVIYSWRSLDRKPITSDEMNDESEKY